jgi:hypothetical protein
MAALQIPRDHSKSQDSRPKFQEVSKNKRKKKKEKGADQIRKKIKKIILKFKCCEVSKEDGPSSGIKQV